MVYVLTTQSQILCDKNNDCNNIVKCTMYYEVVGLYSQYMYYDALILHIIELPKVMQLNS